MCSMINGNNKRERDEHENDVIKPWCVYIQLADAELSLIHI